MSNDPKQIIFGISPLGGNAVEGTAPGMAPIRDTSISGVTLYWDSRVSSYISEQAIEELDDEDISLARSAEWEVEESWRQRVGYTKDGTRS